MPSADSRPTTVPVSPRLRSCSFTTIGLAAASTAAGVKNASAVTATTPAASGRSRIEAARSTRGTTAIARIPPTMSTGPRRRRGSDAIGRPTAEPRPERDPREDRADDRGRRLERDAHERRQQPHGEDLEDEDRRRRAEDDEAGEDGWHGPPA